jgi:hypothetical protein
MISLEGCNCLKCGELLNVAVSSPGNERGPRPGDHMVCTYCEYIMTFDENMRLRHLTDDEKDEALKFVAEARRRLISERYN